MKGNRKFTYKDILGVGSSSEAMKGTKGHRGEDHHNALANDRGGPLIRESAKGKKTKDKVPPTNREPTPKQKNPPSTEQKDPPLIQKDLPPPADDHTPMETNEEDTARDSELPLLEKKSLLALRQENKRTKCNHIRVCSHLDFIARCIAEQKVPKGLTVNVRCNALLAEMTIIEDRFKDTKHESEYMFSESLRLHYQHVKTELEKDLAALEKDMQDESTKATEEERELHQEMMDKTKVNIEKQQGRLEETKKRNFLDLTMPRDKRPCEEGMSITKSNNYHTRGSQRGRGRGQRPQYKPRKQGHRYPQESGRPEPVRRNPTPYRQYGNIQAQEPNQQGATPTPLMQPQPSAPVSQPDLTTVVNMLSQIMQQQGMKQLSSMVLANPPCAAGQHPPPLLAPQFYSLGQAATTAAWTWLSGFSPIGQANQNTRHLTEPIASTHTHPNNCNDFDRTINNSMKMHNNQCTNKTTRYETLIETNTNDFRNTKRTDRHIFRKITRTNAQVSANHKRRFKRSLRTSSTNVTDSQRYITNLTSKTLTQQENKLLSLGLNFIPSSKHKPPNLLRAASLFERSNRLKHFFRNRPLTPVHPSIPPKHLVAATTSIQRHRGIPTKCKRNPKQPSN